MAGHGVRLIKRSDLLKYAILQKKNHLNSLNSLNRLNRLNRLFIYKINNNYLIKQIDVPSGVLNIIYYYEVFINDFLH